MRTVLFICTGNTCRSPMAEAISRDLISKGEIKGVGADVFVASAGVAAGDGIPISEETIAALRKLGISHEGRSVRLTPEMVRRADVVLGMTDGHVAEARRLLLEAQRHPQPAGKAAAGVADGGAGPRIERLDPSGDIPDPVGMGQSAYDRVAKQLSRLLPKRLSELLTS